MTPRTDLTGKRFGMLLVMSEVADPPEEPSGKRYRLWHCRCDCGKELDIRHNALTATKNATKSCGCTRRKNRPRNKKICVVCGKEFECPPSDKTVCCSKECSAIRHSMTHKGLRHTEQTKAKISAKKREQPVTEDMMEAQRKATEAAKLSPLSGSFETNVTARRYVLKAPNQVLHDVVNLEKFIRKHPEWFPNPRSAQTALYAVASGKRNVGQYKGWQVVYSGPNPHHPGLKRKGRDE